MFCYIIIIFLIVFVFMFIREKKETFTDIIFGDNTQFDLSCTNNSIQRYIHNNPITTISPCNSKNLLTAENYFRTTYMNLPLFHYNNEIKPFN